MGCFANAFRKHTLYSHLTNLKDVFHLLAAQGASDVEATPAYQNIAMDDVGTSYQDAADLKASTYQYLTQEGRDGQEYSSLDSQTATYYNDGE